MGKLYGLMLLWGSLFMALGMAETLAPALPIEAEEEVILSYDFEEGIWPWTSVEPLGQVRFTTEPEHVRQGEMALEYEYVVGGLPPEQQKEPTRQLLRELRELAEAGDLETIKTRLDEYLPPPQFTAVVAQDPGDLTDARSIRFSIKTSADTILMLSFSGPWVGMYGTGFYSPANIWQEVWISLDRFQRDEKDPDRDQPIDLSEVTGIALIDASIFLNQINDEELEDPQRWLWLDDFRITTAEGPGALSPQTQDGRRFLTLDDFTGGFISWIPTRGTLRLEVEEADEKTSLHWHYPNGPAQMTALLRPVSSLPAEGAQALRLRLRTEASATLAVLLEEEGDKSTYIQILEVQGDPDWQEFTLDLAGFNLDENKTDENGGLDLHEVRQLMLLDGSAMFGQAGTEEIWLDEVTLELAPE